MKVKEGQRVRLITRPVTAEDRKTHLYYEHMSGLEGILEAFVDEDKAFIRTDKALLRDPALAVTSTAQDRMHTKFADNASEEMKSKLEPEELKFEVNYVLLVNVQDLEPA